MNMSKFKNYVYFNAGTMRQYNKIDTHVTQEASELSQCSIFVCYNHIKKPECGIVI